MMISSLLERERQRDVYIRDKDNVISHLLELEGHRLTQIDILEEQLLNAVKRVPEPSPPPWPNGIWKIWEPVDEWLVSHPILHIVCIVSFSGTPEPTKKDVHSVLPVLPSLQPPGPAHILVADLSNNDPHQLVCLQKLSMVGNVLDELL